MLSYEQRLGCVGTVRRALRSHRDRSLGQLWKTDCTAGCMSRPNKQPGERNRWQGKRRLNLLCVWPVQTCSQLGKFSSSAICVELKRNMKISGRAGTRPCIRLEINEYIGDYCLRPGMCMGRYDPSALPSPSTFSDSQQGRKQRQERSSHPHKCTWRSLSPL